MEFLSNLFWYTVPFILVLSILIFVHEFGHYIVAKLFKVKIEEFSLGFGKTLCSKRDKSGTLWKISAIPFGGYVKMFGDLDGASAPDLKKLENMKEENKKQAFHFKKLYQKFLIVLAGPGFNYLFAIFCFVLLFMIYGAQKTKPIISEIKPNSAAEIANLQVGDEILFIDNKQIKQFEDVQVISSLNFDKELNFQIKRNNKLLDIKLTPQAVIHKNRFGETFKTGLIGIYSNEIEFIKYNSILTATKDAFVKSNLMISNTLKALGQMIMGTRSAGELGGPLKIAKLSKDFAVLGFAAILYFIGILSVNLALINLFPIPVLDGGHLFFYIIEGIIRKPINKKVQEIAFKLGMAFILTFAILITFNDIFSFLR